MTTRYLAITTAPYIEKKVGASIDKGIVFVNDSVASPDNPLAVIAGSRRTTIESDGLVRETWSVISSVDINATRVRNGVRVINSLFEQLGNEAHNPNFSLYLQERIEGENKGRRYARLVSGHFELTDDEIVTRDMISGYFLGIVSVVRLPQWEFGKANTWHTPSAVSALGYSVEVPANLTRGSKPGRIKYFTVARPGGSARMQRIWAGIKPNLTGDLDTFDPVIDVAGGKGFNGHRTKFVADSEAWGGWRLEIKRMDSGRHTRYNVPQHQWQGSGTVDPDHFVGRYHLLAHVRPNFSDAEQNARWGIRGVWKHGSHSQPNFMPEIEIGRERNNIWHLEDLGVLTIGGGRGIDGHSRLDLHTFAVGLSTTQYGYESDDPADMKINLDVMFLVPAEKYIHVSFPKEFKSEQRAEITTEEDGSIYAYVVNRAFKPPGTESGEAKNMRIQQEADFVDDHNWAMPVEDGSVLVVVVDRGVAGEIATTGKIKFAMHVVNRARDFTE